MTQLDLLRSWNWETPTGTEAGWTVASDAVFSPGWFLRLVTWLASSFLCLPVSLWVGGLASAFTAVEGIRHGSLNPAPECAHSPAAHLPTFSLSSCSVGRRPPLLPEGFPCGSAGKESSCNVGDLGSTSGLGRFPGEGKGILAWRIPWTKESDTTERLSLFSFPLPEAHSASVHGVLFLPWDLQTLQPAHYHLSPWNFQPPLTDLAPSSI